VQYPRMGGRGHWREECGMVGYAMPWRDAVVRTDQGDEGISVCGRRAA
jgi:hypothetical protein